MMLNAHDAKTPKTTSKPISNSTRGVFERNVRFLHRSTIGLMCILAMMGLIYIIRLIAFDGKYFAWNEDENIWEGCVCDTSVSGQEVGLPLTPRDLLFGFIPLRLERLLCKFTSLIYVVYIFCYSATSSFLFFHVFCFV